MRTPASAEVTRLLLAWSEGDKRSLEELLSVVYRELHAMARRYMAAERPDHTLQASALTDPNLFHIRSYACLPFNTHRPASAANVSGSLQTALSKVLRTSVRLLFRFFPPEHFR